MAKADVAPMPSPRTKPKRSKDQEEALAWVKERARPRDTKRAALPEAEGAAINEPARPAKPARRRTTRRTTK